jgi:tetratricopeptide (TPR) repeat protein
MGATASGQRRLALEAARKVANAIPSEALGTVPILQGFLVVPYWAMVRFAQWNDILNDKGPRHDTPFTRGAWRYARAMAFTATGRLTEAEQELVELKKQVEDPALKGLVTFSYNTGYAVLRIAPEVVAGEIAAKRKEWDRAVMHLDRAIRYEEALIYQEPPDWHAPVRQTLGAVLLEAGRADEAEAVYWEDLRKNPGTGWSLLGLIQALKAQGKTDEAAAVQQRFEKAWKDADFQLTGSRIGF